jgi:hypothetical protein
MKKAFFVIAIILIVPMLALAQQKDSLIVKDSTGKIVASKNVRKGFLHTNLWRDSAGNRVYNPRKASLYSAVFPGLGQIYNRKYWKVPLVYTAIGIPVYYFFDNKQWYNRTRYALAVVTGTHSGSDWEDSLSNVHPSLQTLVRDNQQNSIINYRNEFRKNMDYSILFTLLFWGLNIVDATVDAHLKGFNVNDNLSMQVRPIILPNQTIGVSLVFKMADNHSKAIP